jgi:hypothetical protein
MDYSAIYDSLVSRARDRNWSHRRFHKRGVSPPCYVEAHHVVPKSLGGDDNDSNVVILTAREHFIAHRLLTKIHPCKAMYGALSAMQRDRGGRKLSSRQVEVCRIATSLARRGRMSEAELLRHHMVHLGSRRSDETRAKISRRARGRRAWNRGKTMTEEQRAPMRKPKTITKVVCPHCGKVGARHVMSRYHFDNCKHI